MKSFAELGLAFVNSMTAYPSIPTYHRLGEKGRVTDERLVTFDGDVFVTEKVDGSNARMILHPDGSWMIGSRNELLTHSGDVVSNPAQGIVETLRSNLLSAPWAPTASDGIVVYYVEVYGGKINGAKNYTSTATTAATLFDVARYPAELVAELLRMDPAQLASWRDHGGQRFDDASTLSNVPQLQHVPALVTEPPPESPADTKEWLARLFPERETFAAIDGKPGAPEGVVVRSFTRDKIAKIRFNDYRRV